MPQTIYMPENPWQQMLPNLVQMYAAGLMRQQFKDPNLVPSGGKHYMKYDRKQKKFVPSTVEMPQEEVTDKGTWEQLDPVVIGGAKIYPQQHSISKKIEYNRFPPQAGGGKGGAGKGTRVDLTPSEIESRKQNLIKNFGHARDSLGQIIEMNKRQKMPKLMNWFRSRDKEGKLKKIPVGELDLAEEAIMADLRIDQAIQDNIKHLRRVGATTAEIIQLLKEEMQPTTRKLR